MTKEENDASIARERAHAATPPPPRKVIRIASAPWHPALASLLAWCDAHPLRDDDPEHDALERLLFQIDGRIRYLERANPETPSP